MSKSEKDEILLSVENVSAAFFAEAGVVEAVRDVSFSIKKGKTFALVGESGCGKSTIALALMRLIEKPIGKIAGGKIVFGQRDLLKLSDKQMLDVRGNKIAMIFQEPMSSLNPVYTVGEQVAEVIRAHRKKDRNSAWAEAVEMMQRVGIAEAQRRAGEYPHQFSGGMCQRVMIAMAISCEPQLLIADEPTSSLDVTIEAQMLDL